MEKYYVIKYKPYSHLFYQGYNADTMLGYLYSAQKYKSKKNAQRAFTHCGFVEKLFEIIEVNKEYLSNYYWKLFTQN